MSMTQRQAVLGKERNGAFQAPADPSPACLVAGSKQNRKRKKSFTFRRDVSKFFLFIAFNKRFPTWI